LRRNVGSAGGDGTTKAHTQKQIDNKALKKIRRRTADAILTKR
jgi:hypothetical protein